MFRSYRAPGSSPEKTHEIVTADMLERKTMEAIIEGFEESYVNLDATNHDAPFEMHIDDDDRRHERELTHAFFVQTFGTSQSIIVVAVGPCAFSVMSIVKDARHPSDKELDLLRMVLQRLRLDFPDHLEEGVNFGRFTEKYLHDQEIKKQGKTVTQMIKRLFRLGKKED